MKGTGNKLKTPEYKWVFTNLHTWTNYKFVYWTTAQSHQQQITFKNRKNVLSYC